MAIVVTPASSARSGPHIVAWPPIPMSSNGEGLVEALFWA